MANDIIYSDLKIARRALGITLPELENRVGISSSYLNRIERGEVKEVLNYKKRQAIINFLKRNKKLIEAAKEVLA